MKKLFHALGVSLACILIVTGVAYAQVIFRNIPVSVTITEGVKAIEVYSEPECINPVPRVFLGQVMRGTTVSFDLFAKNIGVEAVSLSAAVVGDTSSWATIILTPTFPVMLQPNDVVNVEVSVNVLPGAILGEYGFSVEFFE